MKQILLSILLMLSVTMASATQLNITGDLTPSQKAELILQAEKMAAEATLAPMKAQEVREWIEISTAIGEGMAGAAGKLGVEVNKFADTFVGKFTMIVIVWNYMGQEIISIFFGISILTFGIPTWLWMYRTRGSRRLESIREYDKGEGPNGVRKVTEYGNTSEEMKGWYLGVLAVILIVGTLPIIV